MGAVFGVAKIVLVISVLLVIVNSFDEKANIVPKDLKENSLLYQPLSDVSLKLYQLLKNSGLFSDSATSLSLDTVHYCLYSISE